MDNLKIEIAQTFKRRANAEQPVLSISEIAEAWIIIVRTGSGHWLHAACYTERASVFAMIVAKRIIIVLPLVASKSNLR